MSRDPDPAAVGAMHAAPPLLRWSAFAASALLVAVLTSCTPSPAVRGPRPELPFPSPLSGPGRPSLEKNQLRQLERAWQHLAAGEAELARQTVVEDSLEGLLVAELLMAQAGFLIEGEDPTPRLRRLVDEAPEYAAAWVTLSATAERTGDELEALAAARRVEDLWRRKPWQQRANQLYERWVLDRIARAEQLVAAGAVDDALEVVEQALALDPDLRDGHLVKATALIERGDLADAEIILAGLGSDPDAIFYAGQIAERRQDWLTAMDLYGSLPGSYPARSSHLRWVQLQWRLSHLQPHVQKALGSEKLTRAGLAVVLVALVPQVEGIPGGPVPVLSDIVDIPGHREILTAVRVGLLEIDPLEHRFNPDLPAKAATVRDAIDRLCSLVEVAQPEWCGVEPEPSLSCTIVSEPVTGQDVARVVLQLTQEEGT